jgi:hypothetical protein
MRGDMSSPEVEHTRGSSNLTATTRTGSTSSAGALSKTTRKVTADDKKELEAEYECMGFELLFFPPLSLSLPPRTRACDAVSLR